MCRVIGFERPDEQPLVAWLCHRGLSASFKCMGLLVLGSCWARCGDRTHGSAVAAANVRQPVKPQHHANGSSSG